MKCILIGTAILTLASGCGFFSPAGHRGTAKDGFVVEIELAGIGPSSSRSIFSDSNVNEVLVSAYNSTDTLVGSSSLVKEANSWHGQVSVSETGQIRFEARAYKAGRVPLYAGSMNSLIAVGNEIVVVGMSRILALEWEFNGDVNDTSGSGIQGSVHGGPVYVPNRFNKASQAMAFDGDGDYITASADALPAYERTVSLWFKASGIATGMGLIGYGGNGTEGTSYWQNMDAGGTPVFRVSSQGASNKLSYAYPRDPVGRWIHLAATTDADGTKIYLDGTEVASSALSFDTATSGKSLFLGAIVDVNGAGPLVDASNFCYSGYLDDLRIFNRSLTSSEVQALYHEGDWNNYPKAGLVGEWLMDGNALDTSGSGFNGTVNGATLATDRFGDPNGCYYFNGSSNVNVPSFTGTTYTKYSISFWRYSLGNSPASSGSRILRFASGGSYSYIMHTSQAQSALSVYFGGGYKGSPNISPSGQWQHVIVTCDGSNFHTYIDGVSAVAYNYTAANLVPDANGMQIGGDNIDGYNYYFYGYLDDLRIYNRGLLSSEIAELSKEGAFAVDDEPSGQPMGFSCGAATSSSIALSWADASGAVTPDGYLVKWSSVSYAAIADPVDGVAETNGAGVKNVAQGLQACTATGLDYSTLYYFKIWSYSNSGSFIDYELADPPTASGSTISYEPTNHPTIFTSSEETNTSIKVTWTDSTGTVVPDGYLLKWNQSGWPPDAPADGTAEADQLAGDLSQYSRVKNIARAVQTYTITGLDPGHEYVCMIWPYSDSGAGPIDYKLDSPDWMYLYTTNEPSEDPSSFANGATTGSTIDLTWTAAGGLFPAEGYLIKWSSESFEAITEPVDGTYVDDLVGWDGYGHFIGAKNVTPGMTQSCTITELLSSLYYHFEIWSYTTSGLQIDYKLGSPQQISGSTKTVEILTSGTEWTNTNGPNTVKIWVIGAGGGGSGAQLNNTSGGGGGAGGVAYKTFTLTSSSQTFTYSIGAGGEVEFGSSGYAGGDTSATVGATTITAYGGAGGEYNTGNDASGGSYNSSTADGGCSGGAGKGISGDNGGGGGGAIGGVIGGTPRDGAGGAGGEGADVSGLYLALIGQGYGTTGGGAGGGPESTPVNEKHGSNAVGFGCGGGGAGTWGGNGGAGYYGGGGGGGSMYSSFTYGGYGGEGAVVLEYSPGVW